MGSCLMGKKVSVKRVLEMDGDNGCKTIQINLVLLSCTLKNDSGGQFYVSFPTI